MRTSRILLTALSLALLAACTAEPAAVVGPGEKPALDGAGFGASGKATGTDSTVVSTMDWCGAGFCGSGN
jgi:hypothetical protein